MAEADLEGSPFRHSKSPSFAKFDYDFGSTKVRSILKDHYIGLEFRREADELSQGRAVTVFRNALTMGKNTAIFEAQKAHGHKSRGAG